MVSQWFRSFFKIFSIRQQKRLPKRTLFVLGVIVFVAVFGDWLANDPRKTVIPPLIPYTARASDSANSPFFSPFSVQNLPVVPNLSVVPTATWRYRYRHWLGTDELGRDVAAGIISGTRTALFIGVGGVLLALLIGLPIGLAVGFYGDNRLKVNILALILRGCVLLLLLFYFFVFLNLKESAGWILMKLISFLLISELIINSLRKYIFDKISLLNTKITLPLDLIVMRIVEVMQSIPFILWVLGALTIVKSLSITSLILFMGFTSWVSFTRLVRGEMIRIRQLEFMEAAEVLGASSLRIIVRHALPNVLTPVLIAFSFGIANGVLLEAFLSFIGLGLAANEVTWGSLLMAARQDSDMSYWWMAVFPGMAIFLTVYSFNRIGEFLTE
jgi:peptide/nickel transport system permease protein